MVKEVRGEGKLTGIEFQPPSNLSISGEIETIHSSKAFWNDAQVCLVPEGPIW
jgi:hypothetical protein